MLSVPCSERKVFSGTIAMGLGSSSAVNTFVQNSDSKEAVQKALAKTYSIAEKHVWVTGISETVPSGHVLRRLEATSVLVGYMMEIPLATMTPSQVWQKVPVVKNYLQATLNDMMMPVTIDHMSFQPPSEQSGCLTTTTYHASTTPTTTEEPTSTTSPGER
jgi:hypothetical protein